MVVGQLASDMRAVFASGGRDLSSPIAKEFLKLVYENGSTQYRRIIIGRLQQIWFPGGSWRPKTSLKRLTNPGNHENQ